MISKLLIYISTFFPLNTVFLYNSTVFNVIFVYQTWYKHFKPMESNPQLNVVYSYRNLVPTDYPVSCNPSFNSVICQLLSLTMIYSIILFKSLSPTFLGEMSDNCIPPSHKSILCIFHFSAIPYKMYSSINVTCVLGILTILINTSRILAIQYK